MSRDIYRPVFDELMQDLLTNQRNTDRHYYDRLSLIFEKSFLNDLSGQMLYKDDFIAVSQILSDWLKKYPLEEHTQ